MKIEQIIIFEQDHYLAYYPFSIMHPVWELRVGALRTFEKYQQLFPGVPIVYYSKRDLQLKSFLKRFNIENPPLEKKNSLLVSAGFIPGREILDIMNTQADLGEDVSFAFRDRSRAVALYLKAEDIGGTDSDAVAFMRRMLDEYAKMFDGCELTDFYSDCADTETLWNTIYQTGREIEHDRVFFDNYSRFSSEKFPQVACTNPQDVYLGSNVKIAPLCFLDASAGCIIIDDEAEIMANSVICGPCYIGKKSKIKIASKIYSGTTIGENCKIGGEVEDTIIQAYSNKQHDGFLGHSFLGEWVNLGAGTNTSDLKNTYGEINIDIENFPIHTGKQFLGLLCGDHTKAAIGTTFSTGTVAGICSSVVTGGFPQKAIHSFSFGGEKNSPYYDPFKAEVVARAVMQRRNRELSDEEIAIMHAEFNNTKNIFGENK